MPKKKRPRPPIITAAAIKGGTGKTTTAAALAQAAADAGLKVLAIDLDPQMNLSFTLQADPNQPGTYELLHDADPAQVIQTTPQGIDTIAASPDLASETTYPASAKRLQTALMQIKKKYDFIIIDTPPTMGELTFNALQASTGLLIPLEADGYSLQGMYQITDIAHQIQNSNPDLTIKGIILTRYDARPKITRHMKSVIEEAAAETGTPFLMTIRPAIAVREAQAMQQSLYKYAPKCNPAQDYKELLNKLLED